MSEIHFRSISLERMDRIKPNSVYALILTRSRSVEELWPLIEVDGIPMHTWPFYVQCEKC